MVKGSSKKIIFISLTFLISLISAKAQMYKIALEYIITTQGDTLYGEIKFKNSYNIKFKTKGSNEEFTLDPYKVNAVIESENYYKPEEFLFNGNKQKVFLRELISGDVAFYEFTDSSNTESYYVKKKDDKFRKLNAGNYNMIKKALLLNCDSIPEKRTSITGDYRFNIVADQISMHNAKCSTLENPFKIRFEKKKRTLFELKLGLIVTSYDETFYKNDHDSFRNISSNGSTQRLGFNIGIGIQQGITKNFYWNPDLTYNYIGGNYQPYINTDYTKNYTDYFAPIYYTSNAIDFSPVKFLIRSNKYKLNPNFCIGVGARYTFNPIQGFSRNLEWGLSPIFTLGFGFDYGLNNHSYIKLQLYYNLAIKSIEYGLNPNDYFLLRTNSLCISLSYLFN